MGSVGLGYGKKTIMTQTRQQCLWRLPKSRSTIASNYYSHLSTPRNNIRLSH